MADHPVKVPPELVQQWRVAAANSTAASQLGTGQARQDHFIEYIADRTAQWAADQELRVCCDAIYLHEGRPLCGGTAEWLRATRRPKSPSLAEQGMEALRGIKSGTNNCREQDQAVASLAAALNRLAELEAQQ